MTKTPSEYGRGYVDGLQLALDAVDAYDHSLRQAIEGLPGAGYTFLGIAGTRKVLVGLKAEAEKQANGA